MGAAQAGKEVPAATLTAARELEASLRQRGEVPLLLGLHRQRCAALDLRGLHVAQSPLFTPVTRTSSRHLATSRTT